MSQYVLLQNVGTESAKGQNNYHGAYALLQWLHS
jgi:fatty acid/phospholipid biosynthesis enzyme